MQLIVKARHMDLTEALKEHAEKKIGDAISRLVDRPALKLEIELIDLGATKDNNNKECHVTVSLPRIKTIVISEVDDNMYKAIDLCHDRLIHQIKRELGKKQDTADARRGKQKAREMAAEASMTSAPEKWEREVEQFENSQA